MEQIENGFEIGLRKLEKDSEMKQKNLISELDCKIQVSLLDLETNLIKEAENSNSKYEKLKEESHRFESRLCDLAIKSDSNHDLIQSIDKEFGRQLKELVKILLKLSLPMPRNKLACSIKITHETNSLAYLNVSRMVL
jgi:hypothetical protein